MNNDTVASVAIVDSNTCLMRFDSATVWLTREANGKVSSQSLQPAALAAVNRAIARNPRATRWIVRL